MQGLAAPDTAASEALEAAKRAAMDAAMLGDGVGNAGRFRDLDFFVSDAQGGKHRAEEEGFSVRGGTGSQLEGAVLDLTADDKARTVSKI